MWDYMTFMWRHPNARGLFLQQSKSIGQVTWWPLVCCYHLILAKSLQPWQQSLWGQYGANLGPTGPRRAPCWPHEPCYLGTYIYIYIYIYIYEWWTKLRTLVIYISLKLSKFYWLTGSWRSECDFKNATFNIVFLIDIFRSSYDNAFTWMSQDVTDEKSILVPSGNKPLPEPKLTQFYVAIWRN